MKFTLLHHCVFGTKQGVYKLLTVDDARRHCISLDRESTEALLVEQESKAKSCISEEVYGKIWQSPTKTESIKLLLTTPENSTDPITISPIRKQRLEFLVGHVWFLCFPDQGSFFGIMSEAQWRSLGTNDPDDAKLQAAVDSGSETEIVSFFAPYRKTHV